MFSKTNFRWMAGAALALALASNAIGVGSASAQTATATLSVTGDTTIAAGSTLTVNGSSYGADEEIGLWINVPDGTTAVPEDSLGQTDSYVDGTVIPLDAMPTADDNGDFTYTLDTSGLPSGNYSLVAHGLSSKTETVLTFTIQ